jgi:hypothetical protein
MTTDKTRGAAPRPPKATTPVPTPAPASATERAARGSVHEAIGKLIGDDDARDHGSAERRAAARPPRD